jgi:hypothetical protein
LCAQSEKVYVERERVGGEVILERTKGEGKSGERERERNMAGGRKLVKNGKKKTGLTGGR